MKSKGQSVLLFLDQNMIYNQTCLQLSYKATSVFHSAGLEFFGGGSNL